MSIIDPGKQEKILELVDTASQRLLELWPGGTGNKGTEQLGIETKSDGSYVTSADMASNDILVEGMSALFPDDGIISEELSPPPGVRAMDRIWYVDPLDHTSHYIKGLPDFSILIGLCLQGRCEFGIASFPALKQTAVAVKGGGALLNGEGLAVSKVQNIEAGRFCIKHFSLQRDELSIKSVPDSSLAFLELCRGELDGFILKIKSHQEWDIAPFAVIIEESGGRLSDEKGNDLIFNKGQLEARYVVASNVLCHTELLDMIN